MTPNSTFDRNATSVAPRAGARLFSVSRGAAGVVRSTLRWATARAALFVMLLLAGLAGCATGDNPTQPFVVQPRTALSFQFSDDRPATARAGRVYRGALGSETAVADDALSPRLVDLLADALQSRLGVRLKGSHVSLKQLEVLIVDATAPLGGARTAGAMFGIAGIVGVLVGDALDNRNNVRNTYVTIKGLVDGDEVKVEAVSSHRERRPSTEQLSSFAKIAIDDFVRQVEARQNVK